MLSRYLHDLGVFLHFQDDPTLKHYVILKPEWGTTAVYKVLDNETVKKNLGCFTQEDIQHIWKDSEYAEMRDELLYLMMRFKLCYPIPNRLENYIAPQLLSINEPDYTWNDANNLILRYEYEFMPKGMLTRFIVETYPWIEEQKLVWRSGVILNKDQTRAEIIERYNQREIKIRVTGNRKKELLAVITHEFDKIHNSFERLQYETLVPCNCKKCQGSQTPYSYPLNELHEFLADAAYQIQCRKSRQMVDVRQLIDDINLQLLGEESNCDREAAALQHRPWRKPYPAYRKSITPLQQELEQSKESLTHQNTPLPTTPFDRENNCGERRTLASQQRKKIHSALINAFPETSSLEQLLYYDLDKKLNEITQDSNLNTIIFKLIQTAESQGWLLELVRVAYESNPGNLELQAITQELLPTHVFFER